MLLLLNYHFTLYLVVASLFCLEWTTFNSPVIISN